MSGPNGPGDDGPGDFRALFERYCTPAEPVDSDADRAFEEAAETGEVAISEDDLAVQTYVLPAVTGAATGAATDDPGPSALLIHGWGSRASHLAALARALTAAGVRCVAFDLPAHGRSAGRTNTLPRSVRAARRVAAALIDGAPAAVIGHSFGGTAAALASTDHPVAGDPIRTSRLITVSAPASLDTMTKRYLRQNGLPAAWQAGLHQVLWRDHRYRAEEIDLVRIADRLPRHWLIAHDARDEEVPIADADRLAAARPDAELLRTDRYGHVRILLSRPVIRRIVETVTTGPG